MAVRAAILVSICVSALLLFFSFFWGAGLVLCSVCVGLGFGPGPSLVLCVCPSVFVLRSFPCIALIIVLRYLYGACPCCGDFSRLRCFFHVALLAFTMLRCL